MSLAIKLCVILSNYLEQLKLNDADIMKETEKMEKAREKELKELRKDASYIAERYIKQS